MLIDIDLGAENVSSWRSDSSTIRTSTRDV
jgi:hypothetical protein